MTEVGGYAGGCAGMATQGSQGCEQRKGPRARLGAAPRERSGKVGKSGANLREAVTTLCFRRDAPESGFREIYTAVRRGASQCTRYVRCDWSFSDKIGQKNYQTPKFLDEFPPVGLEHQRGADA
jgi:hypothetical protein